MSAKAGLKTQCNKLKTKKIKKNTCLCAPFYAPMVF